MYGNDDSFSYAFWGNSAHTYFANNYMNSSLRRWLTDTFYNTAFSEKNNTNDKVTLLSFKETNNRDYGFVSIDNLYAVGSDYAKAKD